MISTIKAEIEKCEKGCGQNYNDNWGHVLECGKIIHVIDSDIRCLCFSCEGKLIAWKEALELAENDLKERNNELLKYNKVNSLEELEKEILEWIDRSKRPTWQGGYTNRFCAKQILMIFECVLYGLKNTLNNREEGK